jgi:hypothetical protein
MFGNIAFSESAFSSADRAATIVEGSATASPSLSVTATPERKRLASAALSPTSSSSAAGQRIGERSANVSAASVYTSAATRVRESSAQPDGLASVSIAATRVREGASTATSTSSVVCDGRFTARGYAADSAASSTSADMLRVRTATLTTDITVSGTANVDTVANRVQFGSASATVESGSSCDGGYTASGSASTAATTTALLTPARVMRFDGISIVVGTSATVAVARKKWETISNNTNTWTKVA